MNPLRSRRLKLRHLHHSFLDDLALIMIFHRSLWTRRIDDETLRFLEFLSKFKHFWEHWKIFFVNKFTMVFKIGISSLRRNLKICYTIFFHRFIELWTWRIDDETLRFLEFLSKFKHLWEHWKIFFVNKSTMVFKIGISTLRRNLKIFHTIFFTVLSSFER